MAPKNDLLNSTIGEGSVFEGKFYISGSLQIDGKFEGEIKTDEELFVGENGKVRTNIYAKRIVIEGTVIGNLTATEDIKLLSTAKVLGDINAPAVFMEKGVVLKGKINLTGSAKKDPAKVVEDSFNSLNVKPLEGKKR